MSENLNSEDLLKEQTYIIVIASIGKRFANFIIDLIFFIFIILIFSILIKFIYPRAIESFNKNFSNNFFIIIFTTLILYGLILGIIEGITNGKTIGKLITGTRAVNENGSNITFSTAFFRGLSRAISFNGFSTLGSSLYPWHDKWTKTFVIDEKLSDKIPD